MARKFVNKQPEDLEYIVEESIKRIGIKATKDQAKLLLRLVFSGISNYFFLEPDSIIDIGFMRFKKNPAKDELFTVEILRDGDEGVVNAGTLWKYYKGELAVEGKLKDILNGFMDELINYSQLQEAKINKVTQNITMRRRK